MTIQSDRKAFLVDLQRRSEQRDGTGQMRETWTTFRREWASIEHIRGSEYFNASGERATITNRIKIIYGSGIKPRDRVVYQGTVYDIKSVLYKGLDNELMCLEVS